MDKLKTFLEKSGYKFYKNYIDRGFDWYACKRSESKRECTSNEKPVQIVVTPHKYVHGSISQTSVEIDLTAEFNGQWWQLKAYSLAPVDAIKNLDMIEASLVKAWEAL